MLFTIIFFIPFFIFIIAFSIIVSQIAKSATHTNNVYKVVTKTVEEKIEEIAKNSKKSDECVNDFDNTCEHVHLSNEIKEEDRYKIDEDVVVGKGPINTETSDNPIKIE